MAILSCHQTKSLLSFGFRFFLRNEFFKTIRRNHKNSNNKIPTAAARAGVELHQSSGQTMCDILRAVQLHGKIRNEVVFGHEQTKTNLDFFLTRRCRQATFWTRKKHQRLKTIIVASHRSENKKMSVKLRNPSKSHRLAGRRAFLRII